MKNNFQSKSVPRGTRTIWRYLSALLILFTFASGNVWAETQTYSFASDAELSNLTYTAGDASDSWAVCTAKTNSVSPRDGGFVQYKCGKSSKIATFVTTESFDNISNISFYIASSDKGKTQVKIEVSSKSDFSSDVTEIVNATGGLSGLGISSPSNNTWYSVSRDVATKSGYVRFTMTASSSGKYWSFDDIVITYTPASGGGEDPVCPSGLSITSKNDKTAFLEGDAIELTAALTAGNGTITYQWYKGGTAEGNKLTGKTAAKLEIASCVEGDAGDYYCVASKSDCSDAVNADAFTITVAHNPCATHHWFVATADATANGKTNWDGFTNAVTGSSGQTNSVTIDGTTYNLTKRTGSTGAGGTILGFTIPANKAGTLYGYMKSSGSAARILSLKTGDDVVKTNTEIVDGAWTLITIDAIAPGTYTLSPDQNVQVQMFVLKICDATFHTITLDLDGGTGATSIQALDGVAATKPADPTKDHCAFAGWYSGVDAYDWTTVVTAPFTLTAHWTQLYTISFANGGGSGDAPAAIADKAQGETFQVPANTFTAPSASQEFDIWNDGTNDYAPGATYTVGTENVILTAQWKALVAKYTVIFKDGETTLDTKLFEVGSNPSDADIDKTKPLFAFAAWQKDAADIALDDAFWATVVKDATVTLTARWTKAYATSYDMEAYAASVGASKAGLEAALTAANYAFTNINGIDNEHTHNYTYDGMKYKTNDGDLSFNVVAGKVVEVKTGHLPTNDAVTMYINGVADATVFEGADEASETHKTNYFYSAVEALYRLDVLASKGTCAVKAVTIRDPFTVSFEAHGDADPSALQGLPSVTLPDATNGTASLLGWFDAETGGNKIGDAGATYIPTANITLHAQWESISTDARLASITFSSAAGTLSPAFDPEVVNYTYTMPYGTAAVPTITGATSVSAKAQEPQIVSQASAWGETAVIRGVAESSDTKAYNITMKIAPKDGVCLVWADVPADNTLTYNATNSKFYAESDVTLQNSNVRGKDGSAPSGKKFQSNGFLKIALNEGTFLDGDVVALNVTYGTANVMHVFKAQAATSTDVIGEAAGNTDAGLNKVAITEDASTLWLVRGGEYADWNPHVDYVAVYRAMNPVLTAITIDGRAGVIDPLDDKHFNVQIPYEADLANLTIVPTIAWNAPAAENSIVVNDGGAWVEGNNTYKLTDKDGDYTIYTLTLTRDVLKHTVSFNTHGGSAVASELVVDGESLAAAPADPTKDDYLFQGWAETEDGSIVDVTSFTITADKEFHAVWVADGAIKLLDGSTVNHTNFITAVTADETVEFQGNTVNYAKFSGTCSGVNSVKDLTRVIAYNATTNKTKIRISAHNNSTSARNILVKGLVEGASAAVDLATVALGNKEDKVSDWIEFDNAANRTIYIMVSSSAGDVYFTQVKVVESGETPMKQAGEAGYSLNLNKGRFFGLASTDLAFEGLNARLSGDYTALNSGYAKLTSTSMSFTVAAPTLLKVTTNNNKTYYVTEGAAGTDNETAKTGESEFTLTAGTWYITAGTAEVQITNIAFALPKCEKPVFNALANSDLCEGDPYEALDGTGSVTDGGTITYKWYAEGGTDVLGTAATYTPAADGNYYVVALHHVDGFTDNEATSDVVSVTHFASAAITTAPKDQRVDAGQNATLTVVASGKAPLTYQWYTCDDETGANPVIIDGAESDSYVVAVTSGFSQYYKVVVSSGCGEASAVAKVEEWTELPQLDVTASMTWDWTYAGENNKLVTGKNVEIVMANIRENDKIPTNDATFRSQALLFYGENVRATEGGRNYASIGHIAFHTTVPGVVIVEFSDNGSNNRRVSINGKLSEASATKTDVKTFSANVPAGDVTIMGVKDDGTGSNQYIRISKIEFVKVDYTRPVTAGRLGTICLPNGGKMYGAGLYEIAYFDATAKKIFFDEIINGEMIAGRPYIFLPNEGVDLLAVAYTDNADADAGNYKGLYGSYTQEELGTDGSNYILLNNQYCRVVEAHTYVGANRAYIKLGEIGTTPYAAAPGRRRISMGVTGENQAQGFENLQSGDQPMKVMIDGTLYIIRGEKVFDATGRLVK